MFNKSEIVNLRKLPESSKPTLSVRPLTDHVDDEEEVYYDIDAALSSR